MSAYEKLIEQYYQAVTDLKKPSYERGVEDENSRIISKINNEQARTGLTFIPYNRLKEIISDEA